MGGWSQEVLLSFRFHEHGCEVRVYCYFLGHMLWSQVEFEEFCFVCIAVELRGEEGLGSREVVFLIFASRLEFCFELV